MSYKIIGSTFLKNLMIKPMKIWMEVGFFKKKKKLKLMANLDSDKESAVLP